MLATIQEIGKRIKSGGQIMRDEALSLLTITKDNNESFEALLNLANEIREINTGNEFDLCSIMNVKSGSCSENCKFCAQSAHYDVKVDEYELLDQDTILERAREMDQEGVHRFSLVTSGKGLEHSDFGKVLGIYEAIGENTGLKKCASHGIISVEQAKGLMGAGVERYHHNVETSRRHYEEICTTHTYDDRLETIRNCQEAGIEVCSGGIIGMGETVEDRVDMAFELRNLGIRSIPINVLTPVAGTPFEKQFIMTPFEILKTIAVFRLINPESTIRYGGGRNALGEHVGKGLEAGVNGALTGNYLTTTGSNVSEDRAMITDLGFKL